MVSSNNKIVSSRFFEQLQFEQMIMSQFELFKNNPNKLKMCLLKLEKNQEKVLINNLISFSFC